MHGEQSMWGLTFRNLFFPQFCHCCGRRLLTEENPCFCATCWDLSPRVERPFCPKCGRPHPPAANFSTRHLFLCGPCAAGEAPLPFRRLYAAAIYDRAEACAIAGAIKLLKFGGRRRLVAPLAEELRRVIATEMDPDQYDAVIPTPLHPVRLRTRGFNQSELLAEAVAAAFPRARIERGLLRVRPTRTQSRLRDADARRANVRGAFAVEAGAIRNGETVLLVDDVVTTYGTVSECTRVLLEAGAGAVDVLAAALAARSAPV